MWTTPRVSGSRAPGTRLGMSSVDGKEDAHVAGALGDVGRLEWLTSECGVDLSASERGSLVLAACRNKHHGVLLHALKAGGSPDVVSSAGGEEGQSPLHLAARSGDLLGVHLLLAGNASVAALDAQGRTPLHAALEGRHPEIVELLVAHGADVDLPDAHGNTPVAHQSVRSLPQIAPIVAERTAARRAAEAQAARAEEERNAAAIAALLAPHDAKKKKGGRSYGAPSRSSKKR